MEINQKNHIRLKQLSKFNNGNLNVLPQIFQCNKCRKYNTIIPNIKVNIQICYFCTNPNFINKNSK